jgi:hypothetical protein
MTLSGTPDEQKDVSNRNTAVLPLLVIVSVIFNEMLRWARIMLVILPLFGDSNDDESTERIGRWRG